MSGRPYEPERDFEAVARIWVEVGWIPADRSEALRPLLDSGRVRVVDAAGGVDGEAEVCVSTHDGTMRHGSTPLPLCVVSSVTASRIARQGGLSTRLTAAAVAEDAAGGSTVATLSIFDQGFYDRLGFAGGAYVHQWTIDPAALRVPRVTRPPVRLGADDAEEIHACRLAGRRGHGGCTVTDVGHMRTDLGTPGAFGLGFRDDDGTLTHHVWVEADDDVEHGPYRVSWLAHRTRAELVELLGLIRGLGDQVVQVTVPEPPGVPLQQLIDRPFRRKRIGSATGTLGGAALSVYQHRINDVPAAVAAATGLGPEVRFVAELDDPITAHLPGDAPWRGCGGPWTVTLGPQSKAEPGGDARLPTLRCGVGVFTRLWLGVAPATGLAVTDDLDAPGDLLTRLDEAVTWSDPQPDWHY